MEGAMSLFIPFTKELETTDELLLGRVLAGLPLDLEDVFFLP
tara:strand:+ start:6529 stop:6654 length:126 start_codon:yes stop_codon:yes gene_type:complete